MLKMLSNSICFISNNVKGIQSFEKRTKIFEYLEKAIASYGFIFLQETHSTIHDEKKWNDELRENSFSHMVKVILAELLLVSLVILILKSQIKDKMIPVEF